MKKGFFIFAGAVLLFLSGCAVRPEITSANDKPGEEWNISRIDETLNGPDPIEPFNRSMFWVTDNLMLYIVRPVGWIYGSILPMEVAYRVENVSENMAFPGRMFGCLLQGRFKGAGIEFVRFLTNTTIGIAGIFDPAEYYFHLPQRQENMSHAFAAWGLGPGCSFIFPLSTSTNVRDFVGAVFDYALDLKFFLPYACSIAGINRAVNSYDGYYDALEGQQDRYALFRLGLSAIDYVRHEDMNEHSLMPVPYRKELKTVPGILGTVLPMSAGFYPVSPANDTLRSQLIRTAAWRDKLWLRTSLWNRGFANRGTVRSVRNGEKKEKRYYQFWRAGEDKKELPKQDALVILLPGIGAHYSGNNARGYAAMFHLLGYDTVLTTSAMHWQFANTKESAFPGYTPADAKNLRVHLKQILDDLKAHEKYVPKKILLAGYSLGGLHALYIASQEAKEPTLGISGYVAINPPADPLASMDRLYAAMELPTKQWTRSQFFRYGGDVIQKVMPGAQRYVPFTLEPERPREKGWEATGSLDALMTLRFGEEQASFMMSADLLLTMRQLMMNAHEKGFVKSKKNPWNWFRRHELYKEVDTLSSEKYLKEYLLTRYPGQELAVLREESSLRHIAPFLKNAPNVRVLHNLDDPILSDAEKLFLDRTFGTKICWFDCGGHLGNTYTPLFRMELAKMLNELKNERILK